MCQLLVYTNRDIKRRYNKDRDSTVYTTENLSKKNPKAKPPVGLTTDIPSGLNPLIERYVFKSEPS